MDNNDYKKFYLIREDVLPESVVKTLKIKDALKNNPNCPFMKLLNYLIFHVVHFINIEKQSSL